MESFFETKVADFLKTWAPLSPTDRYNYLISLGKTLAPYPPPFAAPHLRVSGCQSTLYLTSTLIEGKVHFQASADALISAGLASLLLHFYNDLSPEHLLTSTLAPLAPLSLPSSLTPTRSNALTSIHLRMKQHAILFLKK